MLCYIKALSQKVFHINKMYKNGSWTRPLEVTKFNLRAKFKSDQVAQARVELSFKDLQEWWFCILSVLNSFVIYFNCLACTSFQFMTTASCPLFIHFWGECLFHKAPLGSKGLQLHPCFSLLSCWTSLQLLLVHHILWTHNQRPTALVLGSPMFLSLTLLGPKLHTVLQRQLWKW